MLSKEPCRNEMDTPWYESLGDWSIAQLVQIIDRETEEVDTSLQKLLVICPTVSLERPEHIILFANCIY